MPGLLALRDLPDAQVPSGWDVYDLDASGSPWTELPAGLRVENRLILDRSPALTRLPTGLRVGSLSLRECTALRSLPEGLCTWFLDMTGCTAFEEWPRRGSLRAGSVVLRGCASLRELPPWLGPLAHLDLAGCSGIGSLPEGLEVSGWIDVAGTQLRSLPDGLQGAPLRWRGVAVDERIAFRPEQLTAREALAERNAEIRRVMIERMGYQRFAAEADAEVLHEDRDAGGPRRLLRIELEEDEPLVGLSCCCPSTGRQYLIRVPPSTRHCHEAAAWIAGFDDPAQYAPEVET